jgi:hypothetical protein
MNLEHANSETIIYVKDGAELERAAKVAMPGTTIQLALGAIYELTETLRLKDGVKLRGNPPQNRHQA